MPDRDDGVKWMPSGQGPGGAATRKCGETHSVGGALMRKRLVGLLAGAVIVFAACGTAASPTPSASAPASQPATSAPPSAPASSGAAAIDLTHTTYKPEEGTDGGGILHGARAGS